MKQAETRRQNFIHGAAILTVGVVIMKILGALYKVPLGNISEARTESFSTKQIVALCGILAMLVLIIFVNVNIGLAALFVAAVLVVFGVADDGIGENIPDSGRNFCGDRYPFFPHHVFRKPLAGRILPEKAGCCPECAGHGSGDPACMPGIGISRLLPGKRKHDSNHGR